MMKKISGLFLLLVVLFGLGQVSAKEDMPPFFRDDVGLVSISEAHQLEEALSSISKKYQCSVAIAIVSDPSIGDILDYANDLYDNQGYGWGSGDDGVLLVIDMYSRSWAVSTYGYGIEAFNDPGIDYIMAKVSEKLSDGQYYVAFETFVDQCRDFLRQAQSGTAYFDGGVEPAKPSRSLAHFLLLALASLVSGALISWGVMYGLKRPLKSVHQAVGAHLYVGDLGLRLTGQKERFLRRQVQHRRIPRTSSRSGSSSGRAARTMRTSSSGRSHGGRSGKF